LLNPEENKSERASVCVCEREREKEKQEENIDAERKINFLELNAVPLP